jgi:hypothetical protein
MFHKAQNRDPKFADSSEIAGNGGPLRYTRQGIDSANVSSKKAPRSRFCSALPRTAGDNDNRLSLLLISEFSLGRQVAAH